MNKEDIFQRLHELEARQDQLTEADIHEMAGLISNAAELNTKAQEETEKRLDGIESNLEDILLHKNMMAAFIEEKGLSDEFNRFVERSIDEAVETAVAKMMEDRQVN